MKSIKNKAGLVKIVPDSNKTFKNIRLINAHIRFINDLGAANREAFLRLLDDTISTSEEQLQFYKDLKTYIINEQG